MPRNKLWKWVSLYLKNYAFLTSISNAAFSRIFRSSWYRRTWPKKICLSVEKNKTIFFLPAMGFFTSSGHIPEMIGYYLEEFSITYKPIKVVKIHLWDMIIVPEMTGSIVGIWNGKKPFFPNYFPPLSHCLKGLTSFPPLHSPWPLPNSFFVK